MTPWSVCQHCQVTKSRSGPGGCLPPKKQIEELVDEGIIGWQRVARQNQTRDALEQTRLEARSDSLQDQRLHPPGPTHSQIECHDAAKRHTHNRGSLQTEPVDQFMEIIRHVGKAKVATKRKTVVFAA